MQSLPPLGASGSQVKFGRLAVTRYDASNKTQLQLFPDQDKGRVSVTAFDETGRPLPPSPHHGQKSDIGLYSPQLAALEDKFLQAKQENALVPGPEFRSKALPQALALEILNGIKAFFEKPDGEVQCEVGQGLLEHVRKPAIDALSESIKAVEMENQPIVVKNHLRPNEYGTNAEGFPYFSLDLVRKNPQAAAPVAAVETKAVSAAE